MRRFTYFVLGLRVYVAVGGEGNGCIELNIFTFAPGVYKFEYLKDIERIFIKRWINELTKHEVF